MATWNMNYLANRNFPELYKYVEVILSDGTIRKNMLVKRKYGIYEWRDYTSCYVVGWRYIEEDNKEKSNVKENKTMKKNNRESRMETLNNAGINTGKYFSLSLPEGLKPGATINITISEDGIPVINTPEKPQEIDVALENYNDICRNITSRYVKNTKLHRRWVMAQMFRMLNYESRNGERCGYDAYLNDMYEYDYQFKMMLDEIRVLSILQEKDYTAFNERSIFFDFNTVIATCEDYLRKLKKYVENLPKKKCKDVPYVRISGNDVFVNDLYKKVYFPIEDRIRKMRIAKQCDELYCNLKWFIVDFVKKYRLPDNTPKCKEWKNAFKGAGAYYTLMNLVKFHGCNIYTGNKVLSGMNAVTYVSDACFEYRGEYYRLFALMKKVIADNKFDFGLAMKEVYANK